ncbi:macrolide resistance MFS transporter Mrx(A) [Flindersiella endophytica]
MLAAQAVSLSGTRLSAIALPWFVLVSTGSATKTGLVAFCELGPYVVAKTLAGPITDRVGARRVSVLTDLVSTVLVGAVPLLHVLGRLHFGVLLVLVALLGVVRGPGDSAKSVLIPQVVEEAKVPLERATGLSGTIERLASTVGAAGAGAVVAVLGPAVALAFDALSFLGAAAIIAATVRARAAAQHDGPSEEGYFQQLRAGFAFLWRDRLLRSISGMVGVTNLLDAAWTAVLLPVWALRSGNGPAAVGLVLGTLSGFSIVASLVAAALAHRLPRRITYLLGFFIAGAPRFLVLAFGAPLWLVIAVHAIGGLGSGFLNPIIGAVILERIPKELLARVSSLTTAVAWAGMPFGGLIGGALIVGVGLGPALLVCGAVYFLATTLPGLQPEWKGMDERRSEKVLVHD